MKTAKLGWIAVPLLVLGTAVSYRSASGQDLPQASANAHLSMTQGFKQSSLALLHRKAVTEREAVAGRLLENLCSVPCPSASKADTGKVFQASDSNWTLEILGDGSAARFQDRGVQKRAHSLATPQVQNTPAAAMETATTWARVGRSFIESKLASVIVLGPEDELVPLRTDYRIEGGFNVMTQKTTRSVVAHRVVFGRVIRGVQVVGGGSTVVMTFANDGSLESFQYDWPQYESADSRSLANVGELLERVQKVIGVRAGGAAVSSFQKAPIHKTPYGIELAKNTTLQKLECGYYDPGISARQGGDLVQPGCVYHTVLKNEDGTRAGFAGAVPATSEIEPDPAWAESLMLR